MSIKYGIEHMVHDRVKENHPEVEVLLKKTSEFFIKELVLHQDLFPKNKQEIFDYNERAYLSMFCNAYLKSHSSQDQILIIQEYTEEKKNSGNGRIDALICDKINGVGFLIEAKLWPHKKSDQETDFERWRKDYESVLDQLNSYKDGELKVKDITIHKLALAFGKIVDMTGYGDYEFEKDDPTDFYFSITDGKIGLEVYGKFGEKIEKA